MSQCLAFNGKFLFHRHKTDRVFPLKCYAPSEMDRERTWRSRSAQLSARIFGLPSFLRTHTAIARYEITATKCSLDLHGSTTLRHDLLARQSTDSHTQHRRVDSRRRSVHPGLLSKSSVHTKPGIISDRSLSKSYPLSSERSVDPRGRAAGKSPVCGCRLPLWSVWEVAFGLLF